MIRVEEMPLYGEDNFFVEQECFRNAKERRPRVFQIEQYIYIYIFFSRRFSTDLNDV